jgi:4-hydroxy-tetrahydrodipicolinate reductase
MQKRTRDEIGIHSVRGGTITGEHTILFAGNDEMIEIKHTAVSRELFAEGALKAAAFLYNKAPGYYKMQDIFE